LLVLDSICFGANISRTRTTPPDIAAYVCLHLVSVSGEHEVLVIDGAALPS